MMSLYKAPQLIISTAPCSVYVMCMFRTITTTIKQNTNEKKSIAADTHMHDDVVHHGLVQQSNLVLDVSIQVDFMNETG